MRITLQIENVDRLETGGQVSYSCADRGFDIGRHEHLDWSLPDPQRVISGKHCEVRFEGGQFVLYDVSTNGTFVNGNPNRMDKAHVLRSGDKVMIGDYIISVALEAGESVGGMASAPSAAEPASPQWQTPQSSAPAAPGPAWPATPPSSQQQPYPVEDSGGPWATGSPGMEGRHAPPSSSPGIGTPADDVWSQQGHGWGSADPALYDPQAQSAEREPVRPARADPLDHLADQPPLQQPGFETPGPSMTEPEAGSEVPVNTPFPSPGGDTPGAEPAKPLFDMPDLGSSPVPEQEASQAPASTPSPEPELAQTPFPDSPDWAAPPPAAPERPVVAETPPEAPAPTGEPPQAEAAAPPPAAAVSADFIKAFAEGAGIPENVLAGRDTEEFARELGGILQGITGDLMGLLQARSQVKAMTRNTNRTLISRSGNNALKFSPTPQMALQTMLSQSAEENGYLPMDKAMSAAFKDIQKHHVWTYAAMQKAAARFNDTMSPKAMEAEGQITKSTFSNQKAKLWERMQDRWNSLSSAYDDGLVGVFTQYFTESYEELASEDPEESSGF